MEGSVETIFWFGGWEALARIAVISTFGYISLIAILRLGGWRRLTRMRLFDFIVTVTIGSAFGRMLTAREVGVADAAFTFAMLILLQQAAARVQHRSDRVAAIISPPPRLLFYRGEFVKDALKREGLREAEVEQAARQAGLGSLSEVEAVVLEPFGEFSVIPRSDAGDGSTIRHVLEHRAS
jgi:uncharacterized membrane protein YcaP (DUF421 family)